MKYLTELKNERHYNRKSINRHSQRVYQGHDEKYLLDKTTDAFPYFFTLYEESSGKHLPTIVKVDGKEYWGEGLTWKEAEELADETIWELVESGL